MELFTKEQLQFIVTLTPNQLKMLGSGSAPTMYHLMKTDASIFGGLNKLNHVDFAAKLTKGKSILR